MKADRAVFFACAVGFGVGVMQPPAAEPPRIVYRTPLLQVLCQDANGKIEYERACRARRKAI